MNTKLQQQLDAYAKLLITQITNVGYCGEFINTEIVSPLEETRLLCLTRGMFFLLDYATITKNNNHITLAQQLYNVIVENYYNPNTQKWSQYPYKIANQNTAKDKMLYEYAFLITAFAKLYSFNGNHQVLTQIEHIKSVIRNDYYHSDYKFAKLNNINTGISQNALMHLFEGLLELAFVTQRTEHKIELQQFGDDLLATIYDNHIGLIRENSNLQIFEPGHSFEWASLLHEANHKNLFNAKSLDYKKLAQNAERYGVIDKGLVITEYQPDHEIDLQQNFRIWPILERLRYYIMINDCEKYNIAIDELINNFFSSVNLPYEYINYDLHQLQDKVKSTTGYHIINCYKYLENR